MGTRKNQACLKAAEKAAFVAAVKHLKASGAYDIFVAQHRTAFMAGANDPAHRGPGFLPWHREYLRRFESALQAIDPSVTLPYWDWTTDNSPASSLWGDDFMGGNGTGPNQRVTTGPFAHATGEWTLTVLDPGETHPFLKRAFGAMGHLPTEPDVDGALGVVPYDSAPWSGASNLNASFRNRLEGSIHNPGHMWVGGSMMGMSSPNDPVFWLHHCNVDRLWAEWQRAHPNEGYLPPSGTPGVVAGHALDDPMPPWAGEPVPPTPRAMLDHHALGYSYDTEGGAVGSPPAASDPFGYFTPPDQAARVIYRGHDDHIHELFLLPGGVWTHADLSAMTGAPGADRDALGYFNATPFGYFTPADQAARVIYRGNDEHVHELFLLPGGVWTYADLQSCP